MESRFNQNLNNIYSLVMEAYTDKKLVNMSSIKTFVCGVLETQVDKIKPPSTKARIYVDSTVKILFI